MINILLKVIDSFSVFLPVAVVVALPMEETSTDNGTSVATHSGLFLLKKTERLQCVRDY